jgi:hypothetical protein
VFPSTALLAIALLAIALPSAPSLARAQSPGDPFPAPIRADEAVVVHFREVATIPDVDGVAPRLMLLTPEPGTRHLMVNEMTGTLYRVDAAGRTVTPYLNINDPRWGHAVQSSGRERGFQSFAFHPQFHERGAQGYGKFYTWADVTDRDPAPDYTPGGGGNTHDTVLLEWSARDPAAARYDGEGPREVLRLEQPYANHNAGLIAFNPTATAGDPDFGMLYVGVADGGSGGDPLDLAQNMDSPFGKILRLDPLGRDGPTGRFGIPADNPFATASSNAVRRAIWASGMRNPQRFGWDPATRQLYVADIGQNVVEELSRVPKGGNLGWNRWEGSYRYANRSISLDAPRADAAMTYPVAEYDHKDPVLTGRAAVTGVVVVRGGAIPALDGRILFGDSPSGEIFHVAADARDGAGQEHIRRVLLADGGEARTFLAVIQAKNAAQGREKASRADLRFGLGVGGEIYLLNKGDGVVREVVGGR